MTTLADLFSFLKEHNIYYETNNIQTKLRQFNLIKCEQFTGTKSGGKKNFLKGQYSLGKIK